MPESTCEAMAAWSSRRRQSIRMGADIAGSIGIRSPTAGVACRIDAGKAPTAADDLRQRAVAAINGSMPIAGLERRPTADAALEYEIAHARQYARRGSTATMR